MPSKLDYQRDNERLRRRHDELTRALSEANTAALDATQRIIDLKEELDVYRAALTDVCAVYIVDDLAWAPEEATQKAVERQLAKFRGQNV